MVAILLLYFSRRVYGALLAGPRTVAYGRRPLAGVRFLFALVDAASRQPPHLAEARAALAACIRDVHRLAASDAPLVAQHCAALASAALLAAVQNPAVLHAQPFDTLARVLGALSCARSVKVAQAAAEALCRLEAVLAGDEEVRSRGGECARR